MVSWPAVGNALPHQEVGLLGSTELLKYPVLEQFTNLTFR